MERPTPPREFEPEWLDRSLDHYYMWGLGFMALLIAGFPIYRWREPRLRAAAMTEQKASYVKVGAQLFAQHCVACHGTEGTGGGIAPTLHSHEFLEATNARQVAWLIMGGVPGTAMSGYGLEQGGPLTDQQVQQVAVYIRHWEEGAPSVAGWRKGERVVLLAVPPTARRPEEKAEGHDREHEQAVTIAPPAAMHDTPRPSDAPSPDAAPALSTYAQSCAACHGAQGQGLVGPAIGTVAYRAGASEARIRQRISEGAPGTAMIAWSSDRGGPLTPAQVEGLVRLIRAGAFRR
jgi:mono/diheme cytochrome c family protein